MEENTTTDKRVEKQRFRSPNSPYASVKECVDLINKLHDYVGFSKTPVRIAYRHMNLTLTSSTSDRIRASMSSYGLIHEENINKEKYIYLSELSRRIILDKRENSPDKLNAYREAALNDPMMKKAWEEWKSKLPSDQATITSILQLKHHFQDRAASHFAVIIRDNFQFCALEEYFELSGGQESESGKQEQKSTSPLSLVGLGIKKNLEMSPSMRQANLLLGNGREIIIYVPNDLTEDEFNRIPMWLEVQKYGLLAGKNDKE